ncbi:MAG: 2-hydroxyacid dehydrogenase [Pseudohongiellaceae bacterium]
MTDSKPDVLVVNNFHPPTISRIDKIYQTHHLWKLNTKAQNELITKLDGKCKAAVTGSWTFNERAYSLSSLSLISAFGVGIDGINTNLTKENQIRVTNTPGVLNDDVADIALTLILTTSRNIINADKYARSRFWEKSPMPYGSGLAGKTLGIVGFGRIGEAVAERVLPLKLKIAYHNRTKKDSPHKYFASLIDLAHNSDILLCILPGGQDTEKVINTDVLKALGPTGIFINIGRGTSVDENSLIEFLAHKKIAAAGLDVYAEEPSIPKALRELDNTVLLPHIGSATIETRDAMGDLVLKNLEAFFSKNELVTEVK